ncbi:MAG TPA: redoxin domain-containing protein [Hyphomonadaceae bacterium]|nr:redoxin domain-containing protein [Hyphomonadaceae bacterium]
MKPSIKSVLISTAAAAALAVTVGVASVTALPTDSVVPEKASNFQLTDTTRLAHELYYFNYAPAIVLMSQTNGSKLSRDGAAELAKLQAAYKDKGVLFYMINSSDTRDAAAAEGAKNKFAVPVLMDELQLVGEQLGVQREGEIFVLNPKKGFEVAYHGPLDDRFTKASYNLKSAAKEAYTADAIDAVLAGKTVGANRVDVKFGKTISFPERGKVAEHANISYTKTVAPILQAKCVACHQKGGIAPFAMDSYEVVKGFAPMMRESVMSERMPPYFPDPHIGTFKNDAALTAEENKTLIHWLDAGAPRGTGEDILKTQAGVAPDWPTSLGKPDVIVQLPSFSVPASGTVEYQAMAVDNPFKGDTWLRAIAVKPGARQVLHHVTSNWSPDRNAPPAKIPGGSVGSYTPGAEPQVIADQAGAPVPAGGKLRFSMHYTTTGKAMTDATQIGYYTLKAPPKYIKRSVVISDGALRIPAGEARHQEIAYLEFPADAYLYTLYPHSHYRGYHVELKQKTPDGKEKMLLSLPKYDFNWQRDYDPETPILVKAGTKLIATWVYDNSDHNKANPNSKIDVTWGEQSWQEMMYFRVNYRWADETVDNLRNDLQAKLMESRTIGGIDDNADDKVEISELRGPMASLKARFTELDLNKDGALDKKELAAGNVDRSSRGGRGAPRDQDIDL